MLQLERGPSVSACGKRCTCLHSLNTWPMTKLPVSINSFFLPAPIITAVIHLLFISSVALNDVNDLLWTVWESIWTLSDTITHAAPGCSRGSTLSAQHWQIKCDWALRSRMDLTACGWEVRRVCMRVRAHTLPCLSFYTLLKLFVALTEEAEAQMTKFYESESNLCTSARTGQPSGSVYKCVFCVYSSWVRCSVNTMLPLISSTVLID